MQFTPRERKLLEKLRKEERLWPWKRWLGLVMGILLLISVACYGYLLFWLLKVLGPAHPDSRMVAVIASLMAICAVLLFAAGSLFCIAIRDWHGNVNRVLLLKLLEAQEQETSSDSRDG
jgi:hypothetical protein